MSLNYLYHQHIRKIRCVVLIAGVEVGSFRYLLTYYLPDQPKSSLLECMKTDGVGPHWLEKSDFETQRGLKSGSERLADQQVANHIYEKLCQEL